MRGTGCHCAIRFRFEFNGCNMQASRIDVGLRLIARPATRVLVSCCLLPGLLVYGFSPPCHAAPAEGDAADPAVPPPALSLAQALRSALVTGAAACAETLDRQQEQAQWAAAQAEFSPVPVFSSDLSRKRADGAEAPAEDASVSVGASWRLPLGTRIEARMEPTWRRAWPGGRTRAVNRVLQIVQPLLKGSGRSAGLALEQARLALRAGHYQRSQALDAVYVSVSLAFFDAVVARQQLGLAQQALQRVMQAGAVNRALHEAGRLAQVDLLQSDADKAQAELNLERARNAARSAAMALLVRLEPAMARTGSRELALPDTLPSEVLPLSEEGQAVAQALARRSDLLLAQTAVEAAHVAVAQAANEARVSLDLTFGAQSSAASAGTHEQSIGLRWSVPLDRSALRLQHVEAQVRMRRAELALEVMRTQVRGEVLDALREAASSQRALSLSVAATELSRRRLDAETERFRAGKISNFQLSAAHDALREAESAQAQAVLAVLRSQIEQDRASGALTARRVALMGGEVAVNPSAEMGCLASRGLLHDQ